jgi:SH3-like domain-containing protein
LGHRASPSRARARLPALGVAGLIALVVSVGSVTSTSGQTAQIGPSGLPLPRFVSVKSSPVNVRQGPSRDHDIAWTYTRSGQPVEITQEFENWRRIRDSDGQEGWVFQGLLSGRRTALVTPWSNRDNTPVREKPQDVSAVTAYLESNVLVNVGPCDGTWCAVEGKGFEGYVEQARLWGVYPGEKIEE